MKSLSIGGGLALVLAGPVYSHAIKGFAVSLPAGKNDAPDASNVSDASNTNDCNGHGTHVAGTVGGSTWGVAKGVSLVPVRVLSCSGSGNSQRCGG